MGESRESERWKILPSPRAIRDLDALPEKFAAAVYEFVDGPVRDNPYRLGGPGLHGELAGLHSARRGGYRVIYQIIEDTHTIELLHIGRRSVVYRPSG